MVQHPFLQFSGCDNFVGQLKSLMEVARLSISDAPRSARRSPSKSLRAKFSMRRQAYALRPTLESSKRCWLLPEPAPALKRLESNRPPVAQNIRKSARRATQRPCYADPIRASIDCWRRGMRLEHPCPAPPYVIARIL